MILPVMAVLFFVLHIKRFHHPPEMNAFRFGNIRPGMKQVHMEIGIHIEIETPLERESKTGAFMVSRDGRSGLPVPSTGTHGPSKRSGSCFR
jgi:hypothetical protein